MIFSFSMYQCVNTLIQEDEVIFMNSVNYKLAVLMHHTSPSLKERGLWCYL